MSARAFAAAVWLSTMLLTGALFAQARASDPKKAAEKNEEPAAAKPAAPTKKAPRERAKTLEELLAQVQKAGRDLSAESKEREAAFLAAKDEQASLLKEAEEEEKKEAERSEALEKEFEENEKQLAELEDLLKKRLGTTGELFGVVRQVAGDTRAQVTNSLTSAQLPGRETFLDDLAQSKELPTIEELEKLWFTMHQEMTESGKVVRFPAKVVLANGETADKQVVRVGTFNAVSGGRYLQWLSDVGQLAELERQPAERFLKTAADLEAADSGVARFAVDPSRGSILSLLVQTPSVRERLEFGGVIGYAILALGAVTAALGILRLLYMLVIGGLVALQRRAPKKPKKSNPLGRIMLVFEKSSDRGVETLERKLDEAILKESGRLDRFLWAIKVVAVVAPLMGLLGTVTGMIRTFQAITLFGTGDPKLMAGGISEALVTTMLGLVVAIPLVLLHSLLSSVSKRLNDVLTEQSAGIVASYQSPGVNDRPTPEGTGDPAPEAAE